MPPEPKSISAASRSAWFQGVNESITLRPDDSFNKLSP